LRVLRHYHPSVGLAVNTSAQRAAVSYTAPHGLVVVTMAEGETVAFGRGAECSIRFGYAPQTDDQVPRVAGHLSVVHGRVLVESSSTVGHKTIEVRPSDGVVVRIPIGEGYSPRASRFDVMVPGSSGLWKLTVSVKKTAPPADCSGGSADPPTNRLQLRFTQAQWCVIEAYLEPVRRGRLEPATHAEVAAKLGKHLNTVRATIYDVWSQMFAEDVPMLDTSDKRIAVVEAIRLHGLTPPQI
jgi:hypothetical protein